MKQVKSTAISVFALALALMWLAPLVWLVGTAFSEPTFHMTFLPNSRFTFGNLSYVWNAIPFARYYLNTLILVVVTFCVQFVTSTLPMRWLSWILRDRPWCLPLFSCRSSFQMTFSSHLTL